MQRSAGVTVIAILTLLGSVLTLGLGLLSMLTPLILSALPRAASSPPPPPPEWDVLMILNGLVFILPAAWGVATGVDLLRLKSWARISIIVFSILLIALSGLSAVMTAVMPVPNADRIPELAMAVRLGLGAFWAFLAAIGAWWWIYFTRTGVKAQFAPAGAPGRRPVSITVIGALFLAGCLGIPHALLLGYPFPFLTVLLTGWTVAVFYLAITALNAAVGVGLLRLKPVARLAAIWLQPFWALNALVFLLAPGRDERLRAYMRELQAPPRGFEQWQGQFAAPPMDITPILIVSGLAGVAGIGLMLYFLITRKRAFYPAPEPPA